MLLLYGFLAVIIVFSLQIENFYFDGKPIRLEEKNDDLPFKKFTENLMIHIIITFYYIPYTMAKDKVGASLILTRKQFI